MIGVLANFIGVTLGSSVGLLAKKAIPESWNSVIMRGIGLCTLYIGFSGALVGENTIILILSMIAGVLIGEGFRIEERFNGFAHRVEDRFGGINFAGGFITASLLMCVGAMSIVGSLDAGIKGDNTLLLTKTVMDTISAVVLSASLGIGVMFAGITVLVLEGGIVLIAEAVSPYLTDWVVNEMSCVGSVLIVAIGVNLIFDAKLKRLNYMPAMFLPLAFCPLFEALGLA